MILVTGATGQLGYEIDKILTIKNIEHISIGKDELDFSNINEIRGF